MNRAEAQNQLNDVLKNLRDARFYTAPHPGAAGSMGISFTFAEYNDIQKHLNEEPPDNPSSITFNGFTQEVHIQGSKELVDYLDKKFQIIQRRN